MIVPYLEISCTSMIVPYLVISCHRNRTRRSGIELRYRLIAIELQFSDVPYSRVSCEVCGLRYTDSTAMS